MERLAARGAEAMRAAEVALAAMPAREDKETDWPSVVADLVRLADQDAENKREHNREYLRALAQERCLARHYYRWLPDGETPDLETEAVGREWCSHAARAARRKAARRRRMDRESEQRRRKDPAYVEKGRAYRRARQWKSNATARSRARRGGYAFDLTESDLAGIFARGTCAYCGTAVAQSRGHPAVNNSATLDRVDPVLGYTKENVALSCYTCNRQKSNWTPETLRALADTIERVSASARGRAHR